MIKIYGPYKRKDGRKHIIIYDPDTGQRQTKSYPKYLLEQRLGRELEKSETCDHINRDFLDDRIENLQVLDRKFHSYLDATRANLIEITCVLCGKKVFKKRHNIRGNSKQGKAGPFCSRQCAGRYGKSIQIGNKPLPKQISVDLDHYRLDK